MNNTQTTNPSHRRAAHRLAAAEYGSDNVGARARFRSLINHFGQRQARAPFGAACPIWRGRGGASRRLAHLQRGGTRKGGEDRSLQKTSASAWVAPTEPFIIRPRLALIDDAPAAARRAWCAGRCWRRPMDRHCRLAPMPPAAGPQIHRDKLARDFKRRRIRHRPRASRRAAIDPGGASRQPRTRRHHGRCWPADTTVSIRPRHEDLLHAMLQSGAAISEMAASAMCPRRRGIFPRRNRLISRRPRLGRSVVVEAAHRSGLADHPRAIAAEQGPRGRFAVAGVRPLDPRAAAGTNDLIKQGADADHRGN